MLAADRDALACDLWETYQVRDMEALQVRDLAMLSCGLRDSSRIKMRMSGVNHGLDTILLAGCYDALVRILNSDAEPASIVKILLNGDQATKQSSKTLSFTTPSAFEEERNRILTCLQ